VTTDTVDDSELLDLVAYVSSSGYRKLVIAELRDETRQPSEIATAGDVARSHVSRALTELKDRGLVEAHGQGARATLYTLTDLGERVSASIETTDE
jgi:predicted transcriptional regulator